MNKKNWIDICGIVALTVMTATAPENPSWVRVAMAATLGLFAYIQVLNLATAKQLEELSERKAALLEERTEYLLRIIDAQCLTHVGGSENETSDH